MANYPFRINIVDKSGHKVAYYTASLATDADTTVSSSVMVTKIDLMPSASFETEESGSTHGALGESAYNPLKRFSNHTSTGHFNYHLDVTTNEANTGSIIFTDRENSDGGGLDFYEFYGSKVCSVLGLPEGIRIYTENFKFSDSSTDTTNYMSGQVISDGVQIKEGLKLSSQARVKSNLIWDDAFGEGYVQWVSGSQTKQFMGYDPVKDLYNLGTGQVTASSATLGATKVSSLSGLTSLNLGSTGTIRLQKYQTSDDGNNWLETLSGTTNNLSYNPDYLDQNHSWLAYDDNPGGSPNFVGDATSGTILRIDAGLGRVGINKISPSYTLDVTGTFGVSGNITVGGTVDGRDLQTDGTKLDGIEASADVTDATNVTAAGALMDSELSSVSDVKAINQGLTTTSTPYFSKITLGKEAASANVGTIYVTSADGDDGLQFVRDDTTTQTNEILGGIGFDSTDGNVPSSILESSAFIAGFASENHTTGDKGGYLRMGVSPVNQDDDTASDQIIRIDEYGMRVGNPGTGDNWISLYAESGNASNGAGISFYETGTFDTTLGLHQYGAKIVYNETDDLFHIGTIQNSSFTDQLRIPRSDTIVSTLHVVPRTDNFYDLGQSGLRWDDVRATNGTIQTSDRNEKTQISGSDLGLDFVNSLNPVKYQFKSGSRTHYGLVAQEVSQSLTGDFAGYIEGRTYQSGSEIVTEKQWKEHKDQRGYGDWEDWNLHSTGSLGLRYNEFISPMIKAIQELSSQVESLRAQISGSG